MKAGGDSDTGNFDGHWTTIGANYRGHGKNEKQIWDKFVSSGSVSPKKRISGSNPSKLRLGELQLVEAMKTQKPLVFYKHIKNNLLPHEN